MLIFIAFGKGLSFAIHPEAMLFNKKKKEKENEKK